MEVQKTERRTIRMIRIEMLKELREYKKITGRRNKVGYTASHGWTGAIIE